MAEHGTCLCAVSKETPLKPLEVKRPTFFKAYYYVKKKSFTVS